MVHQSSQLELWGGVECTINRVGDVYFSQLEFTGHDARVEDLDHFARLGITKLRYPVLWEHTAPGDAHDANWSWADQRVQRLCELQIEPIIGLVHHGSGPRWTSLIEPTFAPGLAAYARAVAERYPWLSMYTPVNEPLTTARFSALYGHWYPHCQSDRDFIQAIINQCRAVVLAMREIRKVNPEAELVQTEDLGRTFSTPFLAYQAEFENHRRWLTFDLLCGSVNADHPLWGFLTRSGIAESELLWFQDNVCPPDVFGLNYYITSERFLDERMQRYPQELHGGNGIHRYADVEAVRVQQDGIAGPQQLLEEVWQRYTRPVAITESHIGCTIDEQVRWFWQTWQAAKSASLRGRDVRAVTAWSLLGAMDWNCLVREHRGHYEPGVFCVQEGQPQPTALVELLQCISTRAQPQIADLDEPGWWQQPSRLLYT